MPSNTNGYTFEDYEKSRRLDDVARAQLQYGSDVNDLILANNIVDRYNMDWYNKFNRFGMIDPYNPFLGSKEYIFFTKPDLNILSLSGSGLSRSLKGNPLFEFAREAYPNVLAQLQSSYRPGGVKLIPMLSNAVSSPLDMPSISSDGVETSANVYGTKITYRGNSMKSDENFSFSIEFEDTRYSEIYMFFKLYDEYERLKWLGYLNPEPGGPEERWINYTLNKILHDQISIFKFIVAEDGCTLLYWAEITGCFPEGVPRDAWSDLSSTLGYMKLTTSWHGHFVTDMNPMVLQHFNHLVKSASGNPILPLYNTDIQAPDGRWASCPYIQRVNNVKSIKGQMRPYQFVWKL